MITSTSPPLTDAYIGSCLEAEQLLAIDLPCCVSCHIDDAYYEYFLTGEIRTTTGYFTVCCVVDAAWKNLQRNPL